MSSVMNIALSGLNSSALRVAVAARNIANAQSSAIKETSAANTGAQATKTHFIPQDIVQIPNTQGGVVAHAKDRDSKFVNIDPATELSKTIAASAEYKSNLKVIDKASQLLGSLVDIFA